MECRSERKQKRHSSGYLIIQPFSDCDLELSLFRFILLSCEELLFHDHDALHVISLFMNIAALNLTSSCHFEITQIKRFRPSGRSKQEGSVWKGSELWRIPTIYLTIRPFFSSYFFSVKFCPRNYCSRALDLFFEQPLGTGSATEKIMIVT